jgi:hypothetical protein
VSSSNVSSTSGTALAAGTEKCGHSGRRKKRNPHGRYQPAERRNSSKRSSRPNVDCCYCGRNGHYEADCRTKKAVEE